jgi:hypothetical protein
VDFIDQLEAVRAQTLPYFDLPDADLDLCYGPGKWSVRFVLNHLADSETIILYRIRRVISEPNQVIWAVDQDAWASKLEYGSYPLPLAKSLYNTSRDGIVHCARHHYAGSEAVAFVHSQTGRRTLKDEFDKVVWHNEQHLRDVKKALSER